MTINPVSSGSQINPFQNGGKQMMQKHLDAVKEKFGEDSFQFSNASKMMNFMSGLSVEEKNVMKAFHEEMHQAAKSGNIDYAKMVENAPEALKAFAEKNDVNLEDMLKNIAERKMGLYGRMGNKQAPNTNEIADLNIVDLLFSDEDEK